MAVKCFIFDLDGTLAFTEEANFLAYKAAFKKAGLDLSEEDFRPIFKRGGHIAEGYEACIARHGVPYNAEQLGDIKKFKVEEYAKRFHLIEPNGPIVGLLQALSPHYHTALATTAAKANAMGVIDALGLAKEFDFMIFGEDVERKKPDPECHEKIAKHFGVEAKECIIFEDSSGGIAAAEAFGAHICKVIK